MTTRLKTKDKNLKLGKKLKELKRRLIKISLFGLIVSFILSSSARHFTRTESFLS